MAAVARLWVPVVTIALLCAAAVITLVFLSRGSSKGVGETVQPSVAAPSATTVVPPSSTPLAGYYPSDLLHGNGSRIFASAAELDTPGQQVVVLTLASTGRTTNQVIVWEDGDDVKTQVLPAQDVRDQMFGGFRSSNAGVIRLVEQSRAGRRELGIVYDATAYGSGSPTAHVALLRLEGEAWQIIWDVDQAEGWRGSHGRVEFPNGDLNELVVHADSFSEGHDELAGVIFEANAGPHRQFVDTWVRDGDAYVRQSAETVPSVYATLVAFLYALATGDNAGAQALVTDAALVDRARSLGLDGAIGKNWMISCDRPDCGLVAGPIRFYAGPPVTISFEEHSGAWLISDIADVQAP